MSEEIYKSETMSSQRPSQNGGNATQVIINQQVPRSNGIGTAGLVLSILGIVLCWLPGLGWILWFLGFLFSLIGLFKTPKGAAIVGFILSCIDLILLVVVVGAIASFLF